MFLRVYLVFLVFGFSQCKSDEGDSSESKRIEDMVSANRSNDGVVTVFCKTTNQPVRTMSSEEFVAKVANNTICDEDLDGGLYCKSMGNNRFSLAQTVSAESFNSATTDFDTCYALASVSNPVVACAAVSNSSSAMFTRTQKSQSKPIQIGTAIPHEKCLELASLDSKTNLFCIAHQSLANMAIVSQFKPFASNDSEKKYIAIGEPTEFDLCRRIARSGNPILACIPHKLNGRFIITNLKNNKSFGNTMTLDKCEESLRTANASNLICVPAQNSQTNYIPINPETGQAMSAAPSDQQSCLKSISETTPRLKIP